MKGGFTYSLAKGRATNPALFLIGSDAVGFGVASMVRASEICAIYFAVLFLFCLYSQQSQIKHNTKTASKTVV